MKSSSKIKVKPQKYSINFLVDFAAQQIHNLGLNEEEQRLTEHFPIAYLEYLRQKEVDGAIISDSLSYPSDEENNEEVMSVTQREKYARNLNRSMISYLRKPRKKSKRNDYYGKR